MSAVLIPAAASHVPPVVPEDEQARSARRRAERVRMLLMTMGSYAIDASLLLLLHFAGAAPLEAVLFYAVGGVVACLFFLLMLRNGWSERFRDPYLTGWQMATASFLQLAAAWLAPASGVLSLTIIFLVFAFSALRLTWRQLLPQWALVSVGLAVLIGLAPQAPALPAATPVQAALSALWLSLAVGRCAFVGLYGASIRQLLGTRNRQLSDARDALHSLASRDELTGALNRRAIMEALRAALAAAPAEGACCPVVALLDLDHFKHVNDAHGHLVGDEVLRRFVRIATAALRPADRLGRYGGEEFLLLITHAPTEGSARAIVERVRTLVAAEDWAALVPGLQITVSAGAAQALPGEPAEALLRRADEALYLAKNSGRNRVELA